MRGGKTILENVSLSLRRQEIVTLLGPNGGGKTTLLQGLLGLYGRESSSIYRMRGLRIGYVPQKLHPSVLMPLSLRRFAMLCSSAPRELVEHRLEELGIADLSLRPLYALSGGELQKAMLARATSKQADCLILDEPLSGVDESGQQKIYAWLERYSRAHNCSVLIASHDLHLVMGATDRVICLDRRIRCEGKAHSVVRTAAFASLFGKTGYALYAHDHKGKHKSRIKTQKVAKRAPKGAKRAQKKSVD